MSALDILKKSCVQKQFLSFKDLPVGDYKVTKFTSYEHTTYGRKIRAELEDSIIHLPKYVEQYLDDYTIAELNLSPVMMIFTGKVNNRIMLGFQSMEEYLKKTE